MHLLGDRQIYSKMHAEFLFRWMYIEIFFLLKIAITFHDYSLFLLAKQATVCSERCNDQFADVPITRTCVNDAQPVFLLHFLKWPSNIHRLRSELIFGARTSRRHVRRRSMCSAIDKHKSRELVRLHLLHSIEQIWRNIEVNSFPHAEYGRRRHWPMHMGHGIKKEISSRTSNRKRYHFFDIKFTRHYVL